MADVKLCADCQYGYKNPNNGPDVCLKTSGHSPVNGQFCVTECWVERLLSDAHCGPEGKFWEPKA